MILLLLLLANKAKGYLKGERKLSPMSRSQKSWSQKTGSPECNKKMCCGQREAKWTRHYSNDKYFWSIVFLCWSRYSTVFSFFCPMLIWCMMVSLVIETQ